jgi:hypothetical protein
MKTQSQILMATVAAVALWTSPSVWADPATSAPSQTATSGGASVGSPTNETPKADGHSQNGTKSAPVAQGSNEKATPDLRAGSANEGKPGAPAGVTTPGTSNGPSVGSPTLETPKADGHSQSGTNGAPVAIPNAGK